MKNFFNIFEDVNEILRHLKVNLKYLIGKISKKTIRTIIKVKSFNNNKDILSSL